MVCTIPRPLLLSGAEDGAWRPSEERMDAWLRRRLGELSEWNVGLVAESKGPR